MAYDKATALILLAAAAKSGDPGAISLAAQLAEAAPCETCGYVRFHCRCGIPALPINMVLFCPACGTQHIDAPKLCTLHDCHMYGKCYAEANGASERCDRWDNPPHKSHLCAVCRHIWRPADVPTNGVAAITTKGRNDSPPMRVFQHKKD